MSQSPPEFKITKHPEFRVAPATGVFGGLNPGGGTIVFYVDSLEPKSDIVGKLSLGCVNRETQIEVHLSPATFKAVADWMTKKVAQFEQIEKQQIAPAKMDQPSDKLYG